MSGIAGPDGGSPMKPIGTVVFARARREGEDQPDGEMKQLDGETRSAIRAQAAIIALELLLPPQPSAEETSGGMP